MLVLRNGPEKLSFNTVREMLSFDCVTFFARRRFLMVLSLDIHDYTMRISKHIIVGQMGLKTAHLGSFP